MAPNALSAGAALPQCLPRPCDVLAFAATLIWLPKVLSGFGWAFSCFGFLISRLLRFWPLAMSERPFDERCAIAGLRHVDRLETVLRCDPLMAFVVIADAILKRISPCRQRAGYAVDIGGQRWSHETALEPDSLSDREEMSRNIVPGGTDRASDWVGRYHDCW
jgi:hypothetical protein